MNYAYTTLLSTDDYLPFVMGLAQGLKDVNAKYPLYVCVTPNILQSTKDTLIKMNLPIIEIPELHYTQNYLDYLDRIKFQYWANIASKFYIFGLEQFDKIVCLDADLLILENIDNLFDYPHLSSVPHTRTHSISGGVLVLEPSQQLTQDLIKISLTKNNNEEVSLGYYFNTWKQEPEKHLPPEYNVYPFMFPFLLLFGINKPKIIHFYGDKSNFFQNDYYKDNPLMEKYRLQYIQLIEKMKNSL